MVMVLHLRLIHIVGFPLFSQKDLCATLMFGAVYASVTFRSKLAHLVFGQHEADDFLVLSAGLKVLGEFGHEVLLVLLRIQFGFVQQFVRNVFLFVQLRLSHGVESPGELVCCLLKLMQDVFLRE